MTTNPNVKAAAESIVAAEAQHLARCMAGLAVHNLIVSGSATMRSLPSLLEKETATYGISVSKSQVQRYHLLGLALVTGLVGSPDGDLTESEVAAAWTYIGNEGKAGLERALKLGSLDAAIAEAKAAAEAAKAAKAAEAKAAAEKAAAEKAAAAKAAAEANAAKAAAAKAAADKAAAEKAKANAEKVNLDLKAQLAAAKAAAHKAAAEKVAAEKAAAAAKAAAPAPATPAKAAAPVAAKAPVLPAATIARADKFATVIEHIKALGSVTPEESALLLEAVEALTVRKAVKAA